MPEIKVTKDSVAIEYDELVKILHAVIDSDFMCYFKTGTRYNCNNITDKAEIMYDLAYGVPYWGENHEFIIVSSEVMKRGDYAIDNVIRDEDPFFKQEWERDVEAIEY